MDWQCIRTKWIDCSKKILWCNIAGDCGENFWNEYSEFWEVRVERVPRRLEVTKKHEEF